MDVKLYLKSFSKITNVPVCVYGAGTKANELFKSNISTGIYKKAT